MKLVSTPMQAAAASSYRRAWNREKFAEQS